MIVATTHYVYDSFDMLVRIETRGPDGAELEPAWQYSYDALGRRTEVRRGVTAQRSRDDLARLLGHVRARCDARSRTSARRAAA